LSFDLWYIFLGLFIICIIEADQIENTNNYVFSFPKLWLMHQWFNIFNVLFEVVSGYACIGLSIVSHQSLHAHDRDILQSTHPSHLNFTHWVNLSWSHSWYVMSFRLCWYVDPWTTSWSSICTW